MELFLTVERVESRISTELKAETEAKCKQIPVETGAIQSESLCLLKPSVSSALASLKSAKMIDEPIELQGYQM